MQACPTLQLHLALSCRTGVVQVQPVAEQGSGRSRRGGSGRWMSDPASCAAALRHVVGVAGQLLQVGWGRAGWVERQGRQLQVGWVG